MNNSPPLRYIYETAKLFLHFDCAEIYLLFTWTKLTAPCSNLIIEVEHVV